VKNGGENRGALRADQANGRDQVWVAEDFDAPLPAGMAAGFDVDEKKNDEG
jgi:hypothetical protein